MMQRITNTEQRYGGMSIFLHWLMAVLIISLVILGLYMVELADVAFNTQKIMLILLHKELGMVALALVIMRFIWRIGNIVPRLATHIPSWQKVAARSVHLAFYGFMVAMPISGWLMSSAAGFPVTFLGLFVLPDLVSPNIYRMQLFIEVHKWLGYALIATIFVHVSAALLHHFIYKDDTLRKILP